MQRASEVLELPPGYFRVLPSLVSVLSLPRRKCSLPVFWLSSNFVTAYMLETNVLPNCGTQLSHFGHGRWNGFLAVARL